MGKETKNAQQTRIYLFGAPRFEKRGLPAPVDTRKATALLAYLLLGETGSYAGYTRDRLAALFYPESDQTSARGALRRTLSALRKAVGSDCLLTQGERVELKMDCLWVDVVDFREELKKIHSHPHSPGQVCRDCLPILERCAVLSEAGFLAGFSLRDSPEFDDWQIYQAEALRLERAAVLDKLSLGLAALGDFDNALLYARRWLALDPLHEDAHRRLMRLYSWKGQRSAALRQYRGCVRVLEQELGVAPLEETNQLYQELLENQVGLPPALVDSKTGAETSITNLSSKRPSAEVDHKKWTGRGNLYPLVGRKSELQTLLETYYTYGKKGFLFALEGEAGIGKSRLAYELLQQVRLKGVQVMQTRCYEGQPDLAYAPFSDSLNAILANGSALERMMEISPGTLSLAAQIAPALLDHFPHLPPPPAPETPGVQVRFYDSVRQVITALLASPLELDTAGVLFLDDLHWADQASLSLLHYLARRLDGIFLLAAWRSDLTPHDHLLRHLLAQIERDGKAASLHLNRLSRQDLGEILEALPPGVPEDLSELLYRETDGNPFFLVEYLDNILYNRLNNAEAAWEIPAGVRYLLQSRLDSTGELGKQLISAAAVVGRSFDFGVLNEVSGRSEDETVKGLEILLEKGLIVEQTTDHERDTLQSGSYIVYDFSHEKLRSQAYNQTSQARKRLLHQRAAEVFARRTRRKGEAAVLAANHYRSAGQLLKAGEWFKKAGEHARSVFANQEAITHFHNALACGFPEPFRLQEAIGDLQYRSGRYQDALESYRAAAALCPAERLPLVEHKLGLVYDQRGEWDLAECHYKNALQYTDEEAGENIAGNPDSLATEKSIIYADWSRSTYRQGNFEQAKVLASQALHLAQISRSLPALAQAYNNLGILERASGDISTAINYLKRSLEISNTLEDPARQAASMNNLARVYADNGHLEEAIRLTGDALKICRQRGDRHREAALHNNMADLYHSSGQEEAAMLHLIQSVTILADIGGEPLKEPQPEIWKLVEW
jgi:DNA-binding SARP family transcriptional activator/Flp pilus assembly protein TadD